MGLYNKKETRRKRGKLWLITFSRPRTALQFRRQRRGFFLRNNGKLPRRRRKEGGGVQTFIPSWSMSSCPYGKSFSSPVSNSERKLCFTRKHFVNTKCQPGRQFGYPLTKRGQHSVLSLHESCKIWKLEKMHPQIRWL